MQVDRRRSASCSPFSSCALIALTGSTEDRRMVQKGLVLKQLNLVARDFDFRARLASAAAQRHGDACSRLAFDPGNAADVLSPRERRFQPGTRLRRQRGALTQTAHT